MNPFSVLTLAIFIAGYITASWDLGIRLYELAIFAWDTGVFVRPLRAQYGLWEVGWRGATTKRKLVHNRR